MSWISRSPFGSAEEAARHMVDLLAQEVKWGGPPLTDSERDLLLRESSISEPIPDDLRRRAKDAIKRVLWMESPADLKGDPKGFGNSLTWAGDTRYPNIAVLTEEVITENGAEMSPSLRGWRLVKDRVQLIGCGVLVVLLMFVMVTVAGFIFHWK